VLTTAVRDQQFGAEKRTQHLFVGSVKSEVEVTNNRRLRSNIAL